MADVFNKRGYDGAGWNITLDLVTDYIGFFGSSFGDGISPGAFNNSSHKTDATASADSCTPLHCRNVRYVSTTEVSLQEAAAVTLNTTNVQITHCTVKWYYEDDAGNTTLENCLFFAFNGSNPATAPTGVTVLAFQRGTSAINTDRVSDTPGDGGAWDSSKGIGGSANALELDDHADAASHNVYIGISTSPTSKGLKTGSFRWEFDAY